MPPPTRLPGPPPPTARAPAAPVTYRIGAVARLTGVSAHALRAWERRYAVVTPARTPAGERLYGEEDVARLRLVKALSDRGHALPAIACLPLADLEALLTDHRPGAAADLEGFRGRFVAAIEALDLRQAEEALSQALGWTDPRTLVTEHVAPIAQEIGDRWARGELSIANEHAATGVLRSFLGTLLLGAPVVERAPAALATTPPGELHELGVLMAALIATTNGWRVVYLGPNLPPPEIAGAVARTRAELVLLSLVNPPSPETREALEQLLAALPRAVVVLAGGRAAPAYADLLGRQAILTRLTDLDRFPVPG